MATREDMTSSRFGRGTCPVCDRSIALLKDGTVGKHDDFAVATNDCAGRGQKPKEG